MHHRIMGRRERESKSEIAGFGGFNLPFPAISNRLESEKETPAQSLRTLFTDDAVNRTSGGRPLNEYTPFCNGPDDVKPPGERRAAELMLLSVVNAWPPH